MTYNDLRKKEKSFLAITSLYVLEFDELLSTFSERWKKYFKHYTFRGKRRRKPLTAGQLAVSTSSLKTNEEKLFFILYFFKNNDIQETLGFNFNMSQAQTSKWLKILTPILQQAIKDLHLQPAKDMDELVRLFRNRRLLQDKDEYSTSFHVDATESPIRRKQDQKAQKEDYSGKKSTHTTKHTVLSDESQFVYFTGFAHTGKTHDKKMIEQELSEMTAFTKFELWFSKDKGYQSYQPKGVHLLEPFKAKRNKPLEKWQKKFNTWISSIRITCEHAIAGIKRCRVIKEKNRYADTIFRNQLFNVAAGLHNLRATRRITYENSRSRVRARINLNF